VNGLRLIPGNVNSADTDNITWAQKQKLFRHLRLLRADQVVLDLGAGSQYDTLDTFLLADLQIGVIVPDALAIENFYLFLKNLKYRQLGNVLSWMGLKERAREIWKQRADYGITNTREFIQHLRALSGPFEQRLAQEQRRLFLHMVLNQVREYGQVDLALAVKSSVQKYFQIDSHFAGYIRYDKDLWQRFGQDSQAARSETPFALHHALESVLDGILDNRPAAEE